MTKTTNGSAGDVFVPARSTSTGWFVWTIALITAVAGLLPGIFGVYYGAVQRNVQFTVEAAGLHVDYKLGRIAIASEDVASVQYVPQPDRMRRISGAAMGDFQMGWYRLGEFGRVYRLTTASGPVVFVDVAENVGPNTRARAGIRYVFSPEDGEAFAEALEAVRRGEALDGATTFSSRSGKRTSIAGFVLLGVVLALPGIAMPVIVFRGRRGMGYGVGPDGITVVHLGRRLYRWADVTDVAVLDSRVPGLIRLIGAALPGYYAGTFRSRPYKKLQLNATRLDPPLVLVKTKGLHLIVTPEDVDGFMQSVARHRTGS